jgi:hypothetical protein
LESFLKKELHICITEVLDLIQAPKISIKGQKYSKRTDNARVYVDFKEDGKGLPACKHAIIKQYE